MFLIKRLSGVFIVTFGVLLLTFLLIHWVPGDPVAVMLGESASSADVAALRIALGLDQPLLQQFGTYLYKLAHADLGCLSIPKCRLLTFCAHAIRPPCNWPCWRY